MSAENSNKPSSQVMSGVVLIVVGVTIFVRHMDLFDIDRLIAYWPLAIAALGLGKMLFYPDARQFCSGVWLVFLGLWLFAVLEHMFGVTIRNSWPIVFVAGGINMVLEPFIRKRFN